MDLVLTDLEMPGLTGDELLRHVRRDRPKLRTALMSGRVEAGELANGLAAPLLRKPFELSELQALVSAVLEPEK